MSRLISVILLLFFSSRLGPAAQNEAQAIPGAVDGKVTDAQTGNGIAGVNLRLYARGIYRGGASALASVSQADGSFRFESVVPGSYLLLANHPDYLSSGGQALSVTVADGQQISDLAIQLNPMTTLSGKVVDEDSRAVPGVTIQLFAEYNVRGRLQLRQAQRATSDASGLYRLRKVNPGKYYLAAVPSSSAPSGKEAVHASDGSSGVTRPGLVRTFYPDALNIEDATSIEIRPGQDLADTTIHLKRAATFHVRGKIESVAPGMSAEGATLSLAPRGSLATDGLGWTARTKPDGSFDIENVQPGSYTLWLTGRYAGNEAGGRRSRHRLLAREDIDVGSSNIDGVVLALMPPITLSGQVTVANTPSQSISQMRINLVPAGQVAFGAFRSLALNPDGSFSVPDLEPGEYSVNMTNAPVGSYIQSVTLNRQDVTNGMDLSQGGSGELDITLRAGAAEVDGTVAADGTAQLTANGTALLVPETVPDDGTGVLLGSVNSTGAFAVRNVRPGRYFAFAVDRWTTLWQNADFLRDMERQGTSLDVPENGHLQIHLSLLPLDQVEAEASRLGLSPQ